MAVFATSLLTEHFGGSPVIAVVLAGVLIGHEMRARLEPSRVLALQGFWEIAAFVINVWLFLLVGMQLRSDLAAAGGVADRAGRRSRCMRGGRWRSTAVSARCTSPATACPGAGNT